MSGCDMICRDVEFWDSIAQHKSVAPHVFMGSEPRSLGFLVENEANAPYASENGGIIFVGMDGLGLVKEMHTMYRPEGWGREVAMRSKAFMQSAFETASLILTHEQEGNTNSRPPLSHGWKPSGDYCEVGLSCRLRLWILTKDAWVASPVGRKMQCQ